MYIGAYIGFVKPLDTMANIRNFLKNIRGKTVTNPNNTVSCIYILVQSFDKMRMQCER